MNNYGYIKVGRDTLDWRWFKTPNTLAVWLYFNLKANHKDQVFEDMLIKRGSLFTSLDHIAKDTGLSVPKVRKAIEHLKKTNDIACEGTNTGTLITLLKYEDYQGSPSLDSKPLDKGVEQTSFAPNKNINSKNQEEKEIKGHFPPSLADIETYVLETGYDVDRKDFSKRFYEYYAAKGWKTGKGMLITDWKGSVDYWARKEPSREQAEKTRKPDTSSSAFSDFDFDQFLV